jgi:hypothetical protein
VHAQRLRRALELAGAEDPDAGVRAVLERFDAHTRVAVVSESRVVVADDLLAVPNDDVTMVPLDEPLTVSMDDPEDGGPGLDSLDSRSGGLPKGGRPADPVEIDLSDAIAALGSAFVPGVVPGGGAAAARDDDLMADLSDLESVLNAMRPRSADYHTVTDAASAYERGLQRLERGQVKEGLEDLEEAARVPAMRFPAAARLGREYIARGQAQAGIEWLERAADMPAPSRDAGLAVLYDLGLALDTIGERLRALAVLMEIHADDPAYRDVPQRLEVLARLEDERRG